MTLRASLHEYVRDELDVSVTESRLPIRPMMPMIVQRFVGGRADQTHSRPVSLISRRVQFDIYANNDKQVDDLSIALLRALDGFHGTMGDVSIGWAGLVSDVDTNPEEVKIVRDPRGRISPNEVRYRRILDFAIAYQEDRPAPSPSTS
jgi:hypothetical protein